jgi:COMPASS component SWD3
VDVYPLMRDAYRIIGVSPESSALRIKREYRRLAKLWHPDKFPHNTAEQRHAAERMRAINEAYQSINSFVAFCLAGL